MLTSLIIFWQVWQNHRRRRKDIAEAYASFFHDFVKDQRYYGAYEKLHLTKEDRKFRSKTPML